MFQLRALMTMQIIILSLFMMNTMANPIGSPEIISKSTVHNVNGNNNNDFKASAPQTILKTYSSSYVAGPKSIENSSPPFKPSYKLPQIEEDFTPQQHSNSASNSNDLSIASATTLNGATPLFMQYLPQMMHEGGVQYLQLIPTRPLIVPISPYINAGATPTASAYGSAQLSLGNSLAEYAARTVPIYTNLSTAAIQPGTTTSMVNVQSNMPEGLRTYADSLQHYHNNFRINREIKGTPAPIDPSLNINEYIPVNPQALQGVYARGRP